MYKYRVTVSDQECRKYSNTDKLVSDGIDYCQVQFILSDEWKDLDCVAQFKQNDKCYSIVLVDNMCKLPSEIQEGTVSIGVFGYKSGEAVRGTTIYLTDEVKQSGFCSDDETPIPPTPDLYSQLLEKIDDAKDAASGYAESAKQSADEAKASKEAAGKSAEEAEKSKNEAAAETGKVQDAGKAAVNEISQAKTKAVQDIQQAGTTQVGAVNAAGQVQQTTIQKAGEAAIQQVQQIGVEQVNEVTRVGDDKLTEIEAVNAILPTPTESDAGKAVVVTPGGTGYELGNAQVDAYTKAESDVRYAPIEAAIRPTVSGNPATLEHSVVWAMQGLSMYGKSTQQTTTGAQLFPMAEDSYSAGGLTATKQSDGSYLVNGTPTGVYTAVYGGIGVILEPGEYYISSDVSTQVLYAQVAIIRNGEKLFYINKGFTIDGSESSIILTVQIAESMEPLNNIIIKPMLNAGSTALPWEPYTGGAPSPSPAYPQPVNTAGASGSIPVTVSDGADQSQKLSIQTPNGLPGIPVDSDGNYTDASGQQWVCDEIDLKSGKYVKRVEKIVIDGEETKFTQDASGLYWNLPMYSAEAGIHRSPIISMYFPRGIFSANETYSFIFTMPTAIGSYFSSVNDLNEFCAEKSAEGQPLELYYCIDPIEMDLTAEELAAYAAMRSYNGTTIVSTEAPVAGLSARYVADGAAYIESKIQAAVTQAVTQAIALTGGNA